MLLMVASPCSPLPAGVHHFVVHNVSIRVVLDEEQTSLVHRRRDQLYGERTTVVEYHDRQLVATAFPCREFGEVQQVVLGWHAGGRVHRCCHGVRDNELYQATTLVEDQEGEEEEVDILSIPGAS